MRSPSNRASTCVLGDQASISALATNPAFGCDKATVVVPLAENALDLSNSERWKTTVLHADSPREFTKREAELKTPLGDIYVRIREQPVWTASVTFNPSRMLDPTGTSLAPVARVRELTGKLLVSIFDVVPASALLTDEGVVRDRLPRRALSDLRLQRLDVTWDAQVESTAIHIESLALTPGNVRRVPVNSRGSKSTIHLGAKQDRMVVYDKHVESKGRAPEGALRVEMQMQNEWLRRHDMTRLGDLTPEAAAAAYLEEFTRLGLQHPTSGGSLMDALTASDLTPTVRLTVFGFAAAHAMGHTDMGLSAATERRYRRELLRVGHRLGDAVHGSGPRWRLDPTGDGEVPA